MGISPKTFLFPAAAFWRSVSDGIVLDERGTVGIELRITILEGAAPQRLDANRELANELATLRDHGYSIYNNWWTYFADEKKWEQHFGESRSWAARRRYETA